MVLNHQHGIRCRLSLRNPVNSGDAEEYRLGRSDTYSLQGGATEGSAVLRLYSGPRATRPEQFGLELTAEGLVNRSCRMADDTLMVDQREIRALTRIDLEKYNAALYSICLSSFKTFSH